SSPLLYKKIVVHIHRRGYYTTNLSMFDVEPFILIGHYRALFDIHCLTGLRCFFYLKTRIKKDHQYL
ncbi:hypothetical protein, partial [Carnobacterium mobile]|uniref:hypothetical protein n=1 Tax=Carnobacterium mobile TaxID=2750 RepID=UPI001D0043EA